MLAIRTSAAWCVRRMAALENHPSNLARSANRRVPADVCWEIGTSVSARAVSRSGLATQPQTAQKPGETQTLPRRQHTTAGERPTRPRRLGTEGGLNRGEGTGSAGGGPTPRPGTDWPDAALSLHTQQIYIPLHLSTPLRARAAASEDGRAEQHTVTGRGSGRGRGVYKRPP